MGNYVTAMLAVFLVIFSSIMFSDRYFELFPESEPEVKEGQGGKLCEKVTEATTSSFQAPADNVIKKGTEADEILGEVITSKLCGGTEERHILSPNLTTYQLKIKNVPLSKMSIDKKGRVNENFDRDTCHFDTAEKLGFDIPEVDKSKFKIFFPEISGEIDAPRPIYSRTRKAESNLLYFIDYGLVFLLHIGKDGQFVSVKGKDTKGEEREFYLADIYQDVGSNRANIPPDAFSCNKGTLSDKAVLEPIQAKSSDQEQLQLQWFLFGKGANIVNGWGIHCKPAIYLYPKEKQLVNVKVNTRGFLSYVDPPYDKKNGWTVFAEPSGVLTIPYTLDAKRYPYLYYESKLPNSLVKKPEKGWVVEKSKLESFFKEILPVLGLNQKESEDFTYYWTKNLDDSPYYFIGLLEQDLINSLEPLEITPKPDYVNRVRVYFEALNEPRQIEEPTLPTIHNSQFTIHNFKVSEWGGLLKIGDSEFTCSQ